MNKFYFLRTLIIFSLLVICSLSSDLRADKNFKLGVVLPITGPISIQGVPMQNAVRLAEQQSDLRNQIEIIFEDDQFIPKNTRSSVMKLINLDKVDALIVFGTNQGMAVVDLTEQAKLPFISISVNKDIVKNKMYAVSLMPSEADLTEKNIQEAQKRGYDSVAIIASQQDSCLNQRKIFENSNKFNITYSDEISPLETNLREHVLKIIGSKPEAVFLSVLPPQGSLLAKLLREMGFKGEIFGGLQIANQAEFNASKGGLLDAWVVSGDDRNADNYIAAYQENFSDLPTSESIYAYDAARLIFAGLDSSKDLNHYLHNVVDFPATSELLSSNKANSYDFQIVAKKFTKNGFVYLD